MKLYIDTSSSEKIVIGLNDERFETDARDKRAQALLPFIVKVLEKEHKSLRDITRVEVFPGPGSFTGLRVGAAIGNALAWSLKIPGYFTRIKYSK
jgi:tRNA threonylcarbamoyladenosine biosynthesis protein TsaB